MSSEFESGFMLRTPSWHKLERAVLAESPKTWDAARLEANLTWEVEERALSVEDPAQLPMMAYTPLPGWKAIARNDREGPEAVLGVQAATYATITNADFGAVIDKVMDITDEDDPVTFEALMSLYGGRQIIALVCFDQKHPLPWDPSSTYQFIAFNSRHDGQGGLRGLPTNVRVVCANTLSWAEATSGHRAGFTIRHTSNWADRVEEIARGIRAARGEGKKWVEFMEQLATYSAGARQREAFLKKFLPITDDDSLQKNRNAEIAREDIRRILTSQTCDQIGTNGYGLLMAATEWSDHVRKAQSTSSAISRQLLVSSDHKARAASILRSMARA